MSSGPMRSLTYTTTTSEDPVTETSQPSAAPTNEDAVIATHTLDAPGATVTYDVHGDLDAATPERPVLLMVGSPMSAAGFGTLASYFTDRPVVTYDPRGTSRSTLTAPVSDTTPADHGGDIARVIEAVSNGPVDVFASSGGAINCLALVASHPHLVRTLVAHEPPLAEYLPDRDQVLAVNEDIGQTYQRSGQGVAMAKFIAFVMVKGPVPADYLDRPAPDPAMFGMSSEDDGSRGDALLGLNSRTCVSFQPDLTALNAADTRVVVAAGEESEHEMTGRASAALAAVLGQDVTVFPSHHGGFLGDEYGQAGQPEAFAARLHEVLDQA